MPLYGPNKTQHHCRFQKTGDKHMFIEQRKNTVALVVALEFSQYSTRLQN